MATAGSKKKPPAKVSVSRSDFYIPPLPLAVAPVRQVVGGRRRWAGLLLVCWSPYFSHVGAMLYLDILEAKHEVPRCRLEKVETVKTRN
jgi:hypothetical protein